MTSAAHAQINKSATRDVGEGSSDGVEEGPVYTTDEVRQHNAMPSVWVTFEDGVYDISDFIQSHPGGVERIMLAAGGPIDAYWQLYQQHFAAPVKDTLAGLRIGTLRLSEAEKQHRKQEALSGPFKDEPSRNPMLKVLNKTPFNAEAPLAIVADSYITPNELWYVRHHHPVPNIDPDAYRMTITGPGLDHDVSLSLSDIKKYPKHEVTVTLQCAGNRRRELGQNAGKPVQGLQWMTGAVSTAKFGGARLVDVLKDHGIDEEAAEKLSINHVWFTGVDSPYDASVPASKALRRAGEVVLAYEMNSVAIPRDHGAPVRSIVPGHIGARNVKWLKSITLSDQESPSPWQRGIAYKGISAAVEDIKTVDLATAPSIQEPPVQSAILTPLPNSSVEREDGCVEVTVKGYALSGGGHKIMRVDVTADEGHTWHEATITAGADQPRGRAWAWVLWEVDLNLKGQAQAETVTIASRAVDEHFNVQPADARGAWNVRGILNNAWGRVVIRPTD